MTGPDSDGLSARDHAYIDSPDGVGVALLKFVLAGDVVVIIYTLAMLLVWDFGLDGAGGLAWNLRYLLYVAGGLSYLAVTALLYWKLMLPALRKVRDARG